MSLTGLPPLQLLSKYLTNKRQHFKVCSKESKSSNNLDMYNISPAFLFSLWKHLKGNFPGKNSLLWKKCLRYPTFQLGCFNCLTNYLPNKRKLFSLSFRSFVLRRKMSGFSAVPRRKSSIHSFSKKLFGRELLRKLLYLNCSSVSPIKSCRSRFCTRQKMLTIKSN